MTVGEGYETVESTLRETEREAVENSVKPGLGRAAWVLSRWDGKLSGERARFVSRSTPWYCSECGDRHSPTQHGPVRIMLPSGEGKGRGVLAGPFDPACALEKLKEYYYDHPEASVSRRF